MNNDVSAILKLATKSVTRKRSVLTRLSDDEHLLAVETARKHGVSLGALTREALLQVIGALNE